MYCSKCGAANNDVAKYCFNCSADLKAAGQPASDNTDVTAKNGKRKIGKAAVIIICAATVCVIAAAIAIAVIFLT